jgi:hypothetical protein
MNPASKFREFIDKQDVPAKFVGAVREEDGVEKVNFSTTNREAAGLLNVAGELGLELVSSNDATWPAHDIQFTVIYDPEDA